jgi:hypothetical protein
MAPRSWTSTAGCIVFFVLGTLGVGTCVFRLTKARDRQKADEALLRGPESARLTAAELVADYRSNGVAADQRYKGRVIEVMGLVSQVGKGPDGGAFVRVATGQESEVLEVTCFLVDARDAKGLTPREPVVVKGRGEGMSGHVLLRPCRVLLRAPDSPRPPPVASAKPAPSPSAVKPAAPASPKAVAPRITPPALPRFGEARFGDLSLSLDDYHVTGRCPGDQTGTSAEGAVFVIVYLTARNVGEDAVDLPGFDYQLGRYRPGLGAGRTCQYDIEAFARACRRTGRLFPGARCEGWILFEVPRAFDTSRHHVKVTTRSARGEPEAAEWILKR